MVKPTESAWENKYGERSTGWEPLIWINQFKCYLDEFSTRNLRYLIVIICMLSVHNADSKPRETPVVYVDRLAPPM